MSRRVLVQLTCIILNKQFVYDFCAKQKHTKTISRPCLNFQFVPMEIEFSSYIHLHIVWFPGQAPMCTNCPGIPNVPFQGFPTRAVCTIQPHSGFQFMVSSVLYCSIQRLLSNVQNSKHQLTAKKEKHDSQPKRKLHLYLGLFQHDLKVVKPLVDNDLVQLNIWLAS